MACAMVWESSGTAFKYSGFVTYMDDCTASCCLPQASTSDVTFKSANWVTEACAHLSSCTGYSGGFGLIHLVSNY